MSFILIRSRKHLLQIQLEVGLSTRVIDVGQHSYRLADGSWYNNYLSETDMAESQPLTCAPMLSHYRFYMTVLRVALHDLA